MALVFRRSCGKKWGAESNAERASALHFIFSCGEMPSNSDFTSKLQQDMRV